MTEQGTQSTAGQPDGGQPKNFLRPCVLLLLREAPAHGYDLLEKLSAFGFARDPGGLYRTLRALEHEGLVGSRWEEAANGRERRIYTLSAGGQSWLDAWAATLEQSRRLLDVYLARYRKLAGRPGELVLR